MAAVDKIYMTKGQYLKIRKWYGLMVACGQMSTEIPFNQYDYDINDWLDGEKRPVWNLDPKEDMWLLSNCPFDFVRIQIMSIYGLREDE